MTILLPSHHIDPDRTKGWIRRILPVALAHRSLFLAGLLTAIIMVVAKVLFPRWTGYALDEALVAPTTQREPLGQYLWTLLAITMTVLLSGVLNRYLLFKTAYALESDLRMLLYQQLSRLSLSFYDRAQTGQLISRANADVRAVQMLLAFGPFIVVQCGMFFLALYFMLRVHPGLTLLSVAILPLVYQIGITLRRRLFPVSWTVQARTADIATIVGESISGVRIIKSFAVEEHQIRQLAQAALRLQWATMHQIRIRARFGPVMENVVRVGEALVLFYGGFLVIDGRIGAGDILVFVAYLVMLQAPFRMLGLLLMMGQRAAASAARIYEVLDETPAIRDSPDAVELVDPRGEVELRDVHFAFDRGGSVLGGLDLHVPAGQTVALVGGTGSGKTTVAELVLRLYDVDRGAVRIDGQDVRQLTMTSLRRYVNICFDEPFLFSTSIRDNIAYGQPSATDADVEAAAKAAEAHEFIVGLPDGYHTVVGERGYTLSGGQRQRIAIARTVLADPRVLILDDATSAIDVQTELEIYRALRRLATRRTTILIAHRSSTIALADRVVRLENGRAVETGQPDAAVR